MTYTPEPWRIDEHSNIVNADFMVYSTSYPGMFYRREDMDRAIACVNACAGIPTEDLKRGQLINGRNPAYAGDEDETIARQLTSLQNWTVQSGHEEADGILCGVLERLGFRKSVEAFESLRKRYA
jgi:hypothetical protein